MRFLILSTYFFCCTLFGQKRVVGYLSVGSENYYETMVVPSIPEGVTDLIIALGYPGENGQPKLFSGDWSTVDTWSSAAERDSVRLWLAIGGGPELAKNFRKWIVENPDEFVKNLVEATYAHNLHGIDLDIEGHLLNDSIIPPDSYEQFVVKLSEALHAEGKQLSGAVATWFGIQITPNTLRSLDYINVMSYDETGPWSPDKPGQHSSFEMMQYDFNYWSVTRKMPANRINLGIPFYGYGFGRYPLVATISYRDIVHFYHKSPRKDHGSTFHSRLWYNGKRTVRKKTQFALASAGGVMIWELGQDCPHKRHSLLRVIVEEMDRFKSADQSLN